MCAIYVGGFALNVWSIFMAVLFLIFPLLFQASYHGHYSFRSSKGSWFVQSLCAHFSESRPEDEIHTVLTRVKRFVALNKTSNVPKKPQLHDKKQSPLSTDSLIR